MCSNILPTSVKIGEARRDVPAHVLNILVAQRSCVSRILPEVRLQQLQLSELLRDDASMFLQLFRGGGFVPQRC